MAIFPRWSTIGSCSCDHIWFLAFEGFTGHVASVPGDHLVHLDMLVHILKVILRCKSQDLVSYELQAFSWRL